VTAVFIIPEHLIRASEACLLWLWYNTGRKVKIYTKSQVEEKKTFEGKLEKFENETIFLLDDTGKVYEIPFSKLKKSNLIYEIPANILESEEE